MPQIMGETYRSVIAIRTENPILNGQEIATRVGVTKQRVSHILKSVGMSTKRHGIECVCIQCGKTFKSRCSNSNLFCSVSCLVKYHRVDLECSNCRKIYPMGKSLLRYKIKIGQKYYFCTRRCHGQWLGKNYGFHRESKVTKETLL